MKISLHCTELKGLLQGHLIHDVVVFIRAINSLGKLGSEIYFEWRPNEVSLLPVLTALTYISVFLENGQLVQVCFCCRDV